MGRDIDYFFRFLRRFGLVSVDFRAVALNNARCWRCIRVTAALVHHPAERLAQLSQTLLGEPFMSLSWPCLTRAGDPLSKAELGGSVLQTTYHMGGSASFFEGLAAPRPDVRPAMVLLEQFPIE